MLVEAKYTALKCMHLDQTFFAVHYFALTTQVRIAATCQQASLSLYTHVRY